MNESKDEIKNFARRKSFYISQNYKKYVYFFEKQFPSKTFSKKICWLIKQYMEGKI